MRADDSEALGAMATRERVWERFGAGSSERCVFNLDPYFTMEMILLDSICEW